MTETPRILPVDPMEAARTPVEGVDLPEGKDLKKVREAAEPLASRDDETLDDAAEAAQRGRTA